MILGNLRRAVQRQDWFAVALEMLIVILSVVIGFQVTEWGNERAARAEERELLVGLRVEFEEVLAGIDEQIGKHRHVEAAVLATLESLHNARRAGAPTATVADSTFAWALVATTTQFSQGILSGMLVTGRLALIRDLELRTALSEWDGVMLDVTEDETTARTLVSEQLDPFLWGRMDVSAFRRYAHYLGTLPPDEAGGVSEFPADTETISLLATRLFWQQHIIREFEGPRSEARRILNLIDRSLQ